MRKMRAKSFLKETLVPNKELNDERFMLEERFKDTVEMEAIRLTFFCSDTEKITWNLSDDELEKYLLGYAVIVILTLPDSDVKIHVLEAIVRVPSVILWDRENNTPFFESITNYYVHNVRDFKTTIGSNGTKKNRRTLSIKGSFFTQQNGLTSCCAHAALRMAINSSPLLGVKKLTNKTINKKLNIDLDNLNGLNQQQIKKVVKSLGYRAQSADFRENTRTEYDHFIYPSLESGFPIILAIEGLDARPGKGEELFHGLAIFGHTLNSDRWDPEARRGYGEYPIIDYIPASSWCCHYVIGDDNYGMYVTLPSDMVRNFIVPTKNPNLHVIWAICIVPKVVTVMGYDAERLAMFIAKKILKETEIKPSNRWLDRLKKGSLVCRTLLQSRDEYSKFLADQSPQGLSPKQKQYLNSLSEYLWVSEVTLPNIYTGNKHKLGDVVIGAEATEKELVDGDNFALAWFPGFIKLGFTQSEPWGIDTHVPLIRNAQRAPLLEW